MISGLGRCPGGGHGNPLQYFCLENPHWPRSQAGYSPWGCKELDISERLSTQRIKKKKKQRVQLGLKINSKLAAQYASYPVEIQYS